jgi:hypothetical protein
MHARISESDSLCAASASLGRCFLASSHATPQPNSTCCFHCYARSSKGHFGHWPLSPRRSSSLLLLSTHTHTQFQSPAHWTWSEREREKYTGFVSLFYVCCFSYTHILVASRAERTRRVSARERLLLFFFSAFLRGLEKQQLWAHLMCFTSTPGQIDIFFYAQPVRAQTFSFRLSGYKCVHTTLILIGYLCSRSSLQNPAA